MKNEENRNPEQQDQLIRETFEQYRAGIESMPSQRAKIVYHMTEKHAPDCRVYYRLAAVAAALVLLLGVVVPAATGNSGLFSRPDQITGDLAALQPQPTGFVPLAQPEETADTIESVITSGVLLFPMLHPESGMHIMIMKMIRFLRCFNGILRGSQIFFIIITLLPLLFLNIW